MFDLTGRFGSVGVATEADWKGRRDIDARGPHVQWVFIENRLLRGREKEGRDKGQDDHHHRNTARCSLGLRVT